MGITKGAHPLQGLRYALLAAVLFWFVFALVSEDLAGGAMISGLVCAGVLGVWACLPKMRRRAAAEEIEKDLGFALMQMAVELSMNAPFEKCMVRVAEGNYGRLSQEFRRAMEEIRGAGAAVQEALFNFASRIDSLAVKRAVAQMIAAYEQGSRKDAGEPLKRIAREHFARQRAVAKEFSGKLVVFSLMFIAVSAIAPALFLAFMAVGSTFMELDFSAEQVLLIAALGFPAIDLAALFYIRSKTPRFLRG